MTLHGIVKPKNRRGAGLDIRYAILRHEDQPFLIGMTDEKICYAGFTDQPGRITDHYPQSRLIEDQSAVAAVAESVLQRWAQKGAADIDFYAEGTDFSLAVWTCLLKIKAGQTVTYMDIAKTIGRPKAIRAVGNAVGGNPVSLFIPCHRVLHTAAGKIGYAWGADLKTRLLAREQKFLKEA